MTRRHRIARSRTVIAVLLTLPFLYPFVFLIQVSVASRSSYLQDPVGFPSSFDFGRLGEVWTRVGMGKAMLNSAIAVGLGVVVLVVVSSMAAFWFHMHRGRTARALKATILMGMALPLVAMVIPLFTIFSRTGMLNELWALGLVYAAINLPFGVFFLSAYYRDGLPVSVLEAARVDGASRWHEFRHIVLPLSRPALATLAALGFVWTWGDLLLSLVLVQDPERRTVTVSAAALAVNRFSNDSQVAAAGALLALLPLIPVFLFAQRALQRGLLTGATK